MVFQNDQHSCGAASMVNALSVLRHRLSLHRSRQIAKTSKADGTSHENLISALAKIGFVGIAFTESTLTKAWSELTTALKNGEPVILSADHGSHWITAIGVCGDVVICFDSDNLSKQNKKVNGIHAMSKRSISKRWKDRSTKTFYGIRVRATN